MSLDEKELRKALEARSGEVTPEYRSRLKQALDEPRPAGTDWMAAVAVIVVTLLTATSVGVLVAARHGRPSGPVASAPRITSPSPEPTASPLPASTNVQLSAPSAAVVWALVDYDALFLSSDHGDHWVKRTVPSNFGIRPSISFINESEGWLLAPGSPETQCEVQLADIWHTTDGARTWQDLGARIDKSQCKDGIWFLDARHGFVTASDPNHKPTVFRSSDGGDHWAFSTVPDNPIFVTSPGGFSLHVGWMKTFGGNVYLEASGTQQDPTWPRDFIYTSNDGGATWKWKQKIASPYTFLVTESRWLMLAPDVDESLNGGREFHPYDTNFRPVPPLEALFPDAEVGYATAGGAVLRTLDGGLHWTQLTTPWPAEVVIPPSPSPMPIAMPTTADLSAPSTNVVWALVGGVRLFVSADRGQTWQERATPKAPAGSAATEISFVDGADGWLSTCANTTTLLWKTTDGARSWHTVSSPFPPDQCMSGLSFIDQSHGFIAARYAYAGPLVYSTVDGGQNWSGVRLPDPPGFAAGAGGSFWLETIKGFGATDLAIAASDAGGLYVYRSTDLGATWTYLTSIPNSVASVGLVTPTRWVQVILPGQSRETTDGGKTWHAHASDYSQAAPIAPQVVYGDAAVGYATVRGAIQRTVDGGLHWTPIQTPGVQQTG